MNAINFIQQYGVEKAREVVEGAPERATVVSALTFKYHFQFKDSQIWGTVSHGLNGSIHTCTRFSVITDPIDLGELKRLVESVDLIKKHGGLFSTKCQLDKGGSDYEWYGENGDYGLTDLGDLEQAIADYESIYSIPESVRQAILNLEKHL